METIEQQENSILIKIGKIIELSTASGTDILNSLEIMSFSSPNLTFNSSTLLLSNFKDICEGFTAPLIDENSNFGSNIVEYRFCNTHDAPISFKQATLL